MMKPIILAAILLIPVVKLAIAQETAPVKVE